MISRHKVSLCKSSRTRELSKGLTYCGRVTHICVCKVTIIVSDNGLPPVWRKVIIWTNAGKLLIGPKGTNFSEILNEIHTFSFTQMHLKISSGNCNRNTIAPGSCCSNFNSVVLNTCHGFSISCEYAPRLMPRNTYDDKFTFVHAMV